MEKIKLWSQINSRDFQVALFWLIILWCSCCESHSLSLAQKTKSCIIYAVFRRREVHFSSTKQIYRSNRLNTAAIGGCCVRKTFPRALDLREVIICYAHRTIHYSNPMTSIQVLVLCFVVDRIGFPPFRFVLRSLCLIDWELSGSMLWMSNEIIDTQATSINVNTSDNTKSLNAMNWTGARTRLATTDNLENQSMIPFC